MATWKTVLKIGGVLPETTAERWYGTPSMKVGGKGFVRQRPESDEVVAVRSAEKEILLAAAPETYYETDHYRGTDWLLVRLPKISEKELREVMTDAWRLCAPPKVRRAHPDV